MTEAIFEEKRIEIENSRLSTMMKTIALNELQNKFNHEREMNKKDSNGFSQNDKDRMKKDIEKKRKQAIELGMSQFEASKASYQKLLDFIIWKQGIDTRLDDSECGSMESAE